MTSVKIFPRLNSINRQGLVPIYLRITKNRRSKYLALAIRIHPEDWNEKTGKLKPAARNATIINGYLAQKEAEAEAIALELEMKSKFVSVYDIKARLLGHAPADFFEFARQRIQAQAEELSVGTIRRHKTIIDKLQRFCNRSRLYFDEINVKLVRDFQQHMIEQLGNHINTIHSNLKVLRKMVKV